MLNPSILDGWGDLHWLKNSSSGKDSNHHRRASRDQGKEEEASNEGHGTATPETEGSSPALLRLRCDTKGEEKHRLGSHRQRRYSMQKISEKQSTMKQSIKEHMIRHK